MKKNNLSVYILSAIVVFALIASGIYSYKLEIKNKPIVKGKIASSDFAYLFKFYFYHSPDTGGIPYYGSENASIMFIDYLKIDSEASKYFIKEVFPLIESDYINSGKIKYYHKNYITVDDIDKKNENYQYAIALFCIEKLKRDAFYEFYFDLFSLPDINRINELLEKYKIPRNMYYDCTDNANLSRLYEEASEVENLGIIGINQRFYIGITGTDSTILNGVPKYEKFQKTIREYEIRLGD